MASPTARPSKRLSHDSVLAELATLAARTDAKAVAGAFVASLGGAPGFWRAPLIALAAARAAPKHAFGPTFSGGQCRECGLTKSVELEEIHEAGQALPGDLAGAVAVLRELSNQGAPPAPAREDARRMSRLLALVGELPPDAREGKLNDAIAREKLVRGNKYDRRHVIETLGACGVLETPEHPGFTTRWTSFASRQDRPSVRVECDPPIAFWSAGHGVDAKNVAAWFGHLGVKAPKAAAPKPRAVASSAKKHAAKKARVARATELEIGDVVAFLVGGTWIAATVTRHFRDASGVHPVVELLDFRSDDRPTASDVRGKRARGARWGKRTVREPYVLFGLWEREDPKGGHFVVARGARPPATKHLPDPFEGSPTFERVKNLAAIARAAGLA